MEWKATLCLALLSVCPSTAQLLPTDAAIEAATVDGNGFICLAGRISSADLPATQGAFQRRPGQMCPDSSCAFGFVVKLTPAADALVWATYLDAAGIRSQTRLAAGRNGNLYIARSSTMNASLPLHGYQTTPASIYVAELSGDGKTLIAGTYFGGSGDMIAALRLDAAGNVYLGGTAVSTGFPVTPGADLRVPATGTPGSCDGPGDEFVAKFDPSMRTLLFSSLIGTSHPETAGDLAIGPDSSLYLAGTNGYVRGPCWEGSLARLSPNGEAVIYSVSIPAEAGFFGAYGVVVDGNGFAYVASDSRAFLPPPGGSLKKFDPQGVNVATFSVSGSLREILLSGDEVVIAGRAVAGLLSTTSDSPPACAPSLPLGPVAYVARVRTTSMQVSYAGYLPAADGVLAGPETLLMQSPYIGDLAFQVMRPGPPVASTITCLANAGTFYGRTVAPGEIVTLFGNAIGPVAPADAEYDPSGNVTVQLAGMQVRIGGVAAPILYAGPNQINLVTPFLMPADRPAHFELLRNGNVVGAFDAETAVGAPGLFTDGSGMLAALNQDGSVNTNANRATPGSVISIFATGLGMMTPVPVDGSRPGGIVSHPNANYQATVNGQPAALEYIGNAPTLVQGLVQLNIRLPNAIPVAGGGTGTVTVQIATEDGLRASGNIRLTNPPQ